MTEQQTVATPTIATPMLRIPRSARPIPTTPRLRTTRLPIWAYAVLIVAVFAGSIVLARDLGWFATTGRGSTSLGAVEGPGSRGGPGTGAGQDSESSDHAAAAAVTVPDDVKGWMTVQQVLDAFPVSKAALYEHFGIPADTATGTTLSSLKESGDLSGFDIPALRTWLGEQITE